MFLFAQLAVGSHWSKPTHTPSHCSAPSLLLQSISFLSAVSSMLLGLCSIWTIALRFPVCGKCYFIWARWCNEKGVGVGVWRPDWSLGAINYCLSLGKALGWPRCIVSSVKKGIVIPDLPPSQGFCENSVRWNICKCGL